MGIYYFLRETRSKEHYMRRCFLLRFPCFLWVLLRFPCFLPRVFLRPPAVPDFTSAVLAAGGACSDAAAGAGAAAGAAAGSSAGAAAGSSADAFAPFEADTLNVLLFPFPLLHVILLAADISFYYLLLKETRTGFL